MIEMVPQMTQCVLRSVMQEKLIQTLIQSLASFLQAIPPSFSRLSLAWVLLDDTLDEILEAECAVPTSSKEAKAIVQLLLRRLRSSSVSELALILHALEAFQVDGESELGDGTNESFAAFLEERLSACVAKCRANEGKSQRMQMILSSNRRVE